MSISIGTGIGTTYDTESLAMLLDLWTDSTGAFILDSTNAHIEDGV